MRVFRPGWLKASRIAIDQVRRFGVFYLALLCGVFTVMVYYPGYMSPDSVVQLRMAREGVTTNVYPPLMSYIWHFTDRILPGPGGILILHNLVFWASLAIIAHSVTENSLLGALFVVLAGLWPPTFGLLGTIWKDVGMQAFLLGTVATILYAAYVRRLWPLMMALLCLFIAGGYRHNALAAGLPLLALILLYVSYLLPSCHRQFYTWLQRNHLGHAFYALMALATLVLVLGALHFVYFYKKQDAKLWSAVLVHDLVGISVLQNVNYLPSYVNPHGEITLADVKRMYSPLHANSLYIAESRRHLEIENPLPDIVLSYRLSEADASHLRLHWLTTVLDHFGSYLRHRLLMAERLLVVRTRQPWAPYITGIEPNPFGITFKPSPLNREVMKVIEFCAFSTPLYSAWVYYLILGGCSVLSFLWDFSYARTIQTLAVSSFLYLLTFFFFGMSGDFRYNIWALTSCYICLLLLCAGRGRKVQPPEASVVKPAACS